MSLQVYLQVAQKAKALDFHLRFSGMMFKVLQHSYTSSQLATDIASTTERLSLEPPNPLGWDPVGSPRQSISHHDRFHSRLESCEVLVSKPSTEYCYV